jgi:hypothetical protein
MDERGRWVWQPERSRPQGRVDGFGLRHPHQPSQFRPQAPIRPPMQGPGRSLMQGPQPPPKRPFNQGQNIAGNQEASVLQGRLNQTSSGQNQQQGKIRGRNRVSGKS